MVKLEKQLEQLRKTQSAVNDLFLVTNNHEISTILYNVMSKLDKVEEIIKNGVGNNMSDKKEITLKYDQVVFENLKEEHAELKAKIANLKEFLHKYKPANDEYSIEQFGRMSDQLEEMKDYIRLLQLRIMSMNEVRPQ